MADALRRIVAARRSVAAFAVVVEAIDAHAAAFYRRLGFTPFPSRTDRLFMLAETAATAIAAADRRG